MFIILKIKIYLYPKYLFSSIRNQQNCTKKILPFDFKKRLFGGVKRHLCCSKDKYIDRR